MYSKLRPYHKLKGKKKKESKDNQQQDISLYFKVINNWADCKLFKMKKKKFTQEMQNTATFLTAKL